MSTEEVKHLGFSAEGELSVNNGFEDHEIDIEEESSDKNHVQKDCTILWWNGEYQKPNISITKGKISVGLGRNVKKIQLRHASNGGVRYYKSGTHSVPNGEYVLSLFGSTYPHKYIKACVTYE